MCTTCCFPDLAAAAPREAQGDLQLRFAIAPDGRTYLDRQFSRYPFHICRAQYVDPDPKGLATIYLQSSAGGIFADDRLSCVFHALPKSQAHITTQASTVVHRMDNGDACHDVEIRAEANSFLEYLPDPMILFPMAKLRSSVVVQMHPSATVLIADAFTSHDPVANQDNFTEYHNETRVEDLHGKLLCLDRYCVSGKQFCSGQLGVMGKNAVQGTFMLLNSTHSSTDMCELLRRSLQSHFDGYAGVSTLPNGCGAWVRLVAFEAFALRSAIQEVWAVTRQAVMGTRPHNRRK